MRDQSGQWRASSGVSWLSRLNSPSWSRLMDELLGSGVSIWSDMCGEHRVCVRGVRGAGLKRPSFNLESRGGAPKWCDPACGQGHQYASMSSTMRWSSPSIPKIRTRTWADAVCSLLWAAHAMCWSVSSARLRRMLILTARIASVIHHVVSHPEEVLFAG